MRLGSLAFVSTLLVSVASPAMAQMDPWYLDDAGDVSWVQEVAFSFAGLDAGTETADRVVGLAVAMVSGSDATLQPITQTSFTIFFDWDSAALTPESNQVLDDVVMAADGTGSASLILGGYADVAGAQGYNLGLSEQRANAAADGLIARGIAPEEIVIRSFGGDSLEISAPDSMPEPQQRLIEIFLS